MSKSIPPEVLAELRLHYYQRKVARYLKTLPAQHVADLLMSHPELAALNGYLDALYPIAPKS